MFRSLLRVITSLLSSMHSSQMESRDSRIPFVETTRLRVEITLVFRIDALKEGRNHRRIATKLRSSTCNEVSQLILKEKLPKRLSPDLVIHHRSRIWFQSFTIEDVHSNFLLRRWMNVSLNNFWRPWIRGAEQINGGKGNSFEIWISNVIWSQISLTFWTLKFKNLDPI